MNYIQINHNRIPSAIVLRWNIYTGDLHNIRQTPELYTDKSQSDSIGDSSKVEYLQGRLAQYTTNS